MAPCWMSRSTNRSVIDCVRPEALVNRNMVPCGPIQDSWVRSHWLPPMSRFTQVPTASGGWAGVSPAMGAGALCAASDSGARDEDSM